jgi:hypothetical protein
MNSVPYDDIVLGFDANVSEKHTVSIFWAEESETLVHTFESTRRHNPEEQHRHPHRRENLKSQSVSHVYIFMNSTPFIRFHPEI